MIELCPSTLPLQTHLKMSPLFERKKTSIAPLQISSPMEEVVNSKQPIVKNAHRVHKKMGDLMSFFSCKYHQTAIEVEKKDKKKKRERRILCSVSLCNLRESSKVMQRPESSSSPVSNSSRYLKGPSNGINGVVTATNSSPSSNLSGSATLSSPSPISLGGSFRGMHLRKLSGCYECHMVVDPINGASRVPSLRRCDIFPCSQCGDIFTKSESLEFHKATRHAVSELGPEDNSRNIVEIIFKSSWLKKQPSMFKINRILKIHNTQKIITRFEAYRDSIKIKSNKLSKKYPRCIADGNELLRFHCTAFNCSLGLNGSTNLCISTQSCNLCSILRDGFKPDGLGKIRTMATIDRAHDCAQISTDGKERAMLVCRMIAGRVKKNQEGLDECDSVVGNVGLYSTLDELFVFDPKAILPCFVVIYKCF